VAKSRERDDDQMTLIEHLAELRRRIFICAIAVVACAVVVFIFFPPILEFLEGPYQDVTKNTEGCGEQGCELIATNPLAPFTVRIKVSA
jgi:sec-independent protein translocase protein TatC